MSDPVKKKESQNRLDAYRKTEVMTANKETILLMMYAGAIRFLRRAIEASEKEDYPEKGRLVGKTQEIITELRSTLNFEIGGEIAIDLERLYLFISQRLLQGTLDKKTDALQDALKILLTLNDAWEKAVDSLKKEKAQSEK